VLSPYREIFAAPGTRAFSAAGFVSRMPQSMLGIGVVTMVSQLTGAYRLAGALSATLALSAAAIGPQVSRLVDRFGQRRVLRPCAAVTVAAVTGLVLCAWLRAPAWTLFVCAVAAGCTPSAGSMVRARWALLYRGTPLLHTAYSYESVVDEVCFIVGPVLAIGGCTALFPEAGPVLAAVFLGTGFWALTAQRATEPPPHPPAHHTAGSAMRSPGLRVLVATFVATGTIFGSMDVVTVAFAGEQGHKAAASLVLSVYALGSCVAGVVRGLVRPKRSEAMLFLTGTAVMAVSMIPLLLVGNLYALGATAFVSGLTIAPTMVVCMALVERLVPRPNLTEGMTWTSTGLTAGVAVGSSLAGWVVDASGAHSAYAVPVVAAAVAAVVAFLGRRRLLPAPGPVVAPTEAAPEWEGTR
jgi:MFS family permease